MGDIDPVSAAMTAMWVGADAEAGGASGEGGALSVFGVFAAFGAHAAARHTQVMAEARMMVATLLRTAYVEACMGGSYGASRRYCAAPFGCDLHNVRRVIKLQLPLAHVVGCDYNLSFRDRARAKFEVAGCAPDRRFCGCNSVVECHLAKVDVEGSSPFTRFHLKCLGPKQLGPNPCRSAVLHS